MSARQILNVIYFMLLEGHGEDEVHEMLNPPTIDEQRATRIEQLRALGVRFEAV